MKALFFGVVTLFIVGMSNDAQAACNAISQANCRAMHQDAGLTYEQCVAKWSKLISENPVEARRIAQRTRICGGYVAGGQWIRGALTGDTGGETNGAGNLPAPATVRQWLTPPAFDCPLAGCPQSLP